MNNLSYKDYLIAFHRRAEVRAEAKHAHLARQSRRQPTHIVTLERRRVRPAQRWPWLHVRLGHHQIR